MKIERIIEDLLDRLGFEISSKGYQYWYDAILIGISNPFKNITKIYEAIAQKYFTSYSAVERAMRQKVIKSKKILCDYFDVPYTLNNKNLLGLIIRDIERKSKEINDEEEEKC